MLRIVIIDDEPNVRITIRKLLDLLAVDYIIIGEAGSVTMGKELVIKLKPDLLFLDIELEDGTGFDLLRMIPNPEFELVFITAYNDHAITAFKYNALDYILKPIDPDELLNAINKVKLSIQKTNELDLLLANMESNRKEKDQKLVVKTLNKTFFIPIKDIKYMQSDGAYTMIHTLNNKILTLKNLKHYQDILSPDLFTRSHQSYIVNKRHIIKRVGSNLLLSCDTNIPISFRRKVIVSKWLEK
ncbi:MAG: LytTR family DNA-binding domain-containing protein [Saprospiraceae bacterium]